jgi:hypothetical protein
MNKKQQNIVTSKSTNTVAIFLLSNHIIIDAWPSLKDHEKWKFSTNIVNIFQVNSDNSKLIPYSHQPKGALFMGTKLTMPGKPWKVLYLWVQSWQCLGNLVSHCVVNDLTGNWNFIFVCPTKNQFILCTSQIQPRSAPPPPRATPGHLS